MMMHCGRVGSTVLASLLTAQDLLAAGEIHNTQVYPGEEWWDRVDYVARYQQLFERRLELPQPYLKGPPTRDASVYLFEYKPFQPGCGAPLGEAIARFRDAGVQRFISLVRLNPLRRYVSSLVSQRTGVWHTTQPSDRPNRVHIDVNLVIDFDIGFTRGTLMEWLLYFRQTLTPEWNSALQPQDTLWLTYEDHIERDPLVAYAKVVEFLALDPARPAAAVDLVRQNAWPLRELIENFDEVERTLRGTPFATYLED